ncbi:MAG: hypothetical protein JSW70_05460 [Syntrophobacterales bacterium]|nr:MAG: hypothetical protein JSW70_05460 [Syntrophobacterales bacterium]
MDFAFHLPGLRGYEVGVTGYYSLELPIPGDPKYLSEDLLKLASFLCGKRTRLEIKNLVSAGIGEILIFSQASSERLKPEGA